MASLSFEGETHQEIITKVRRWLRSVEEGEDEAQRLTAVEAVERGADLTKEALRVVASAAPGPVASSDVMKQLTSAGYRMTDSTRQVVVSALDALSDLTGGGVVRKRVEDARKAVVYEMNSQVAKQVLKALRG